MATYNEPKYDTDLVNKGYLDKVVGIAEEDIKELGGSVSKKNQNFGTQPTTPYYVNDTWMNGTDIYICVRQRLIGDFNSEDWSLASNYTDDTLASKKSQVFINEPVPPYNVGDLWTTGPNGVLYRCRYSRGVGETFNLSDWENATSYDDTETVVQNGLVTTGTVQVVNGGESTAGITGNVAGDDAVRFWAGSQFDNRASAPFRVTQGGYLYAANADISGTIITENITATGGTIGGWTINNYKIFNEGATAGNCCCIQIPNYIYDVENDFTTNWVFAAGSQSHESYGEALFRVHKDGSLYATYGSIGGFSMDGSSLYGSTARGTMRIRRGQNASIDFPCNGGRLMLASTAANGIALTSAGPVCISDYYDDVGTGDVNATVGIRARNGNIRLATSYDDGTNKGAIVLSTAGGGVWLDGTQIHAGSSRTIKKNITELDQNFTDLVYNNVKDMRLYKYDYKDGFYNGAKDQYGFILEELKDTTVEEVLHIKDDEVYSKTFNNDDLPRLNLIVIKELQKKIEELENEIKLLKGGI